MSVPAKKIAMVEFYRGKLNEQGWNVPAVVFEDTDTEEVANFVIRDLRGWYEYTKKTPAEKQAIHQRYLDAGFVVSKGGLYA